MNNKILTFLLIVGLLMMVFGHNIVLASDTGTNTENIIENVIEDESGIDEDISCNDEIIASIVDLKTEVGLAVDELKNIVALLLILVVFETLRIVRSWSKGVGVK